MELANHQVQLKLEVIAAVVSHRVEDPTEFFSLDLSVKKPSYNIDIIYVCGQPVNETGEKMFAIDRYRDFYLSNMRTK